MKNLTNRQQAVIERIEENDGVLPKNIERYFQDRTLDSLRTGGRHGFIAKITYDLVHMMETVSDDAIDKALDLHGVIIDQYVSIQKLEEICADAHLFDA